MLSLFDLTIVVAALGLDDNAAATAVNAAKAMTTFMLNELQRTYACRHSHNRTGDARRNTLTIYSCIFIMPMIPVPDERMTDMRTVEYHLHNEIASFIG